MVFCGKPSKGCKNCRDRKIRCDQLPEGCTQCAKASKSCPGYRDQLDLMFRNENKKVVSKAKAREAGLGRASSEASKPSTSFTSQPGPVLSAEEAEPLLANSLEVVRQQHLEDHFVLGSMQSTFSLAPTVEEAATGFFFLNYVIDTRGPTKGHLEQLHNIYNTYQMDENLLASMKAVGLAGYAHVAHTPQLMKDARHQYIKALRLTNGALRSPTDAKKDSTLLAIMVLGIFETVTGCNQKSLQAWAEHVSGAAALVSLRGMEKLRTIAGRRMFAQVCTGILTNCIQRRLPIPTHIMELRAQIAKHIPPMEPAWWVQEYMVAFANFSSEIKRGIVSDPQVILSKALKIDSEIQAVFSYAPADWKYEIIFTDDTDCRIYNGSYHVYYDSWVAQLWNGMRTIRILLNEQIREAILAGLSSKPPLFLGPAYTAQVQTSTDVVLQMQADILATVPQHTGYIGNPDTSLSILPTSDPFPRSDRSKSTIPQVSFTNSCYPVPNRDRETPQIRASGGYFLMWPLFLCGVMDLASEPTRRWITQMFRYIGRTMAIQQAFMLAEVVERREEIKVW